MRFSSITSFLVALSFSMFAVLNADATLIPSQDGKTVYDTVLHVNWLADANLAAPANSLQFGLNINPDGSMNYATAVQWVAALNGMNGGLGYLGHNNWRLPTSPNGDSSCDSTGPFPYQNSFGFGCLNSDMASLFNNHNSLGLLYPNTAVPIANNAVGPFSNLQPYLYWSDTLSGNDANGYSTFSFNTGWRGSNVDDHYIYALPMIPGKLPGTPAATGTGLQVNPGGATIYDPVSDVTWLANADLAKTQTFGAQCANYEPSGHPNHFPPGIPCIETDGSMTHTTALNWITGMKTYNGAAGWLGQTNWQLPPITDSCGGFNCSGNPIGELFYGQLGLSKGNGVATPNNSVGSFHNFQPYLYWSSCEPPTGPSPCPAVLSDGVTPAPAPGFEWSFSFGNGFQGTDVVGNNLYVMVYYPAARVTVNGRVVTSDGRGLRNSTVSITDSNGVVRTATTSSFGFFSFDNVAVGDTYVFRVSSRLFRYQPQTVQVSDNLTLPDFVGLE